MSTVLTRFARRRTLVLTLLAALAASTAAWAYWAAQGSGAASGHVGSLPAPSITSATPGGGTVTLQWSAITAPGAGAVSYYVSRDGGVPSSACPSSSAPSAQTSCTDTGVSIASHSYNVTAVWRSWTARSSSASAQVLTGPATHLLLTPATTSPTAGVVDNLTITAQDAGNNTVTSYTGAKSLTFGGASSAGSSQPTVTNSSGTAVGFGTAEPMDFANGVATVSGANNGAMKLYKAETAKITVSDGTLSNGSGVSVTVAPAVASSFALATPSTQTAGTAFGDALTALDPYGNTATGYSGSKTVVFSGPSSSPNGKAPVYPATVSFSSGVGTAAGITLYNAVATTLGAKEGSISGTSGSFTVSPGSVSSFAVPTPPTQSAGSPFEIALTALDAYGNAATGYAGSKTLSFSGPANSPNGKAPSYPSPVSFSAGVGTVKGIVLYNAAATTLTAKEGSISGSSSTFTVSPATASSFTVPTPSTQTAGTAFNEVITAKDAYGNTATGYAGSKPIAFSGPQTSSGGEAPKYPASVSFSAGVGTASITIYDAGSTTLNAQDGSISGTSGSFTVNGLSTTSKFLLSTPSPTAGKSFTETITATDAYGNTTTGYTGSHTLTFSGPAKSPDGASPKYPFSSTSFSAGVGTASITLYDAQTTTLSVEASGSIKGTSANFTVVPAGVEEFGLGTPVTQTAGVAFSLTLTAKDEFGNVVTGYEGAKTVAFKGPGTSPGDNAPSYPSSVSFSAGVGNASITLYDADTSTSIEASQGTASDSTGNFAVNAASMSGLSLAAATTTPTAGASDSLTITAVDAFGNTVTSYTSNHTLTFGGAATLGANHPTVSNSGGSAVNFGTATTISFSSGVAKVSGSNNGVMKLYAAETAKVTVSDGTFSNGSGLSVTVAGAAISSLTLTNHNTPSSSARGKIEAGDSLTVDFNAQIAVNSMCSAWSGNTTDHSITGSNEVTVTVADGAGSTNDTLSVGVTASKCTFHLGTIDLGSGGYVSSGNATFGGSSSNKSTIEYTASTGTLEVLLGAKSGLGSIKQVSSSAATLTPDASLTDAFGNTLAAFTTSTVQQF